MDNDYQTFVARLATHEDIPPPFSHVYTLGGNLQGPFALDYAIYYTDRDELSEEEIADEGFGPNDDRQCRGQVPDVWQQEVAKLLARTREAKQPNPGASSLILQLTKASGDTLELRPGNQPEWEYLLQELVQALLESAKLERPLHLEFLANRGGQANHFRVDVSFAERRGTLSLNQAASPVPLPWPTCKELMKLTFNLDLDPDQAQTKLPKAPGFFVSPAEGEWYEGGTAAQNPTARNQVLAKLEELLGKLAVAGQ
jgi:hypothetical protein